ncbi:MAG: sulfatase-like hydrolase/transferase [Candidatus Sumerlaeia bacterium]|nr:sulfatase-like hydrolase/transferase [Candidatus Sumerlaeia bacterium]
MSKSTRRTFIKSTTSAFGALGALAAGTPGLAAPKARKSATPTALSTPRPNILWITCEDMSPHLGCYGDSYAHTPNLDRLAEKGVRYTHAFATGCVCSPARSTIITGVYASSLGTQNLRGIMPWPKQICCFTEYLRKAGYYCSNNVKEDYNFVTPPTAWDESSAKAHWRNRKPGQPFYSVFNLMTTHQGQTRYGPEELKKVEAKLPPDQRYDPAKAPLPPYYPDTPLVRHNMAVLYTQVTLMDRQVGEILAELEKDGLAEDTIVFFFSDHGDGLPRHKRWLHDSGTRVPMILHFPKKFAHLAPEKAGGQIHDFVNFVDLAPTMLSLAGIEPPAYMQGRAFLGPYAKPAPERTFCISDRVDEVFECSRGVREKRWHYIRNFMPHRPRMQFSTYSEPGLIRSEIRRLAAEGALQGAAAWLAAPNKPAEELYDVEADPHEINNLAGNPKYEKILLNLRRTLHEWMVETRDMALLPEPELTTRDENLSPYDMARETKKFPAQRILQAASLVGMGPQQLNRLVSLLGDSDSAVRYWAATGLAALGPDAERAKEALRKALGDSSPSVRITAAEALSNLGGEAEALPVLQKELASADSRIRLHAAATVIVLGPKARPLAATLKQVRDTKCAPSPQDEYCQWAIDHALDVIEGRAKR